MFNAKEYLATLQPPTYVDTNGVEHTGKAPSFNEALNIFRLFDEIRNPDNAENVEDILSRLLTAIVNGFGFTQEVGDDMASLPADAMNACLIHFFTLAGGTTTKKKKSVTTGAKSPDKAS